VSTTAPMGASAGMSSGFEGGVPDVGTESSGLPDWLRIWASAVQSAARHNCDGPLIRPIPARASRQVRESRDAVRCGNRCRRVPRSRLLTRQRP